MRFYCICLPLVLQFLVLPTHQVSTNMGLEHGDNLSETFVTHVLKHTQDTSLEEDLGDTKSVLVGVHLQSCEDLVCNLFAIDESLWDSIRSQDGVSEIK